jgi:beta-hydroxylase
MFLPGSDFPWTRKLEAGFPEIKPEFEALDRRRFKRWPEVELYNHGWEAFGLLGFGRRFEDNLRLCPRLAATLERIPGLTTAGFSVLLLDVVKPGETFDDDTPGRDLLIDYFRSG